MFMPMIISHKYEVTEQLGQGGMGVVYKVRHVGLDTIFALKILPPHLAENLEMVARFYREARFMARLKHPNIAQVLDIDRDDSLNCHYFVMEYIQGKTLQQYVQENGPLPLLEVIEVSRQVAKALAYAHAQTPPIIHRDIKPANIMIEDSSGRVVVMDFGIAKELTNSEVIKSGTIIGTMRYCSPEQMRHEPLDGGADIYALGMVMYEAYTGASFFAGLDDAAVVDKVLYDPQEHSVYFTRPTSPTFTRLVTKAIAKSRVYRYQRVDDLLHDLEVCLAPLETFAPSIATPTASVNGEFRGEEESDTGKKAPFHGLQGGRQRQTITLTQAQQVRENPAPPSASVLWQPQQKEVKPRSLHEQDNHAGAPSPNGLNLSLQPGETAGTPITPRRQVNKLPPRSDLHGHSVPAEDASLRPEPLSARRRADFSYAQDKLRASKVEELAVRSTKENRSQERDGAEAGDETTIVEAPPTREILIPTEGEDKKQHANEDPSEIGKEKEGSEIQILDAPPPVQPARRKVTLIGGAILGLLMLFMWERGLFSRPMERPLVLVRVDPQEEIVKVAESDYSIFAAEAKGSLPLQYQWTLDGQLVSQKKMWAYHPTVGASGSKARQVSLLITDQQGQRIEKHWQVTVSRPNLPPHVLTFTPTKETFEIADGTTQVFRLEAEDPEDELLAYEWTVDGKTVGTQPTLNWKATGMGSHLVRAVVSDQSGLRVTREWQIAVPTSHSVPSESGLPPKNTPPQITQHQPNESTLTVAAGERLTFSTVATDREGDTLTYAWSLDGRKITQGVSSSRPTLSWKAQGVGDHRIQTVVSDRAGLTATEEWQVTVLDAAPEFAEDASLPDNTPPEITEWMPAEDLVKIPEGESLTFSATAIGSDGGDLRYEWTVNGKKVSQEPAFSFTARGKGTRRVELTIVDQRGLKSNARWEVQVTAPSVVPQLIMFTPHEAQCSLYPHMSRFFGVEVEMPGTLEPDLRYEWKIDGQPVEGEELLEFKNQSVGTHEVEVTVFSPLGASIAHRWTVQVLEDEKNRPMIYSPDLEIVDLENVVSPDRKRITVKGKLRNSDEERSAANVVVWVTALNAQGEAIERRMTLPSPQPLAPGEVANFQVQFANRATTSDFHVEAVIK